MKKLSEPLLTCTFTGATVQIENNQATCNYIVMENAEAEFCKVECHDTDELFYFSNGISTMLFIDCINDELQLDSCGYYSIPPQTVVIVPKGKYHYVGPSITKTGECFVMTSSGAKTKLILL